MDMSSRATEAVDYSPAHLLNELRRIMKAKTDRELADLLEINSSILSKIRHNRLSVGGAILIRMHEVSGLSTTQLRHVLGDRRKRFRMGVAMRKGDQAISEVQRARTS